MITKEQAKIKQDNDKKEGFRNFMAQPMTRAMISTLPPSEHLEVLLQAMFYQGYNCGAVSATINLMEAILDSPRGPKNDN